jgi:hypothetical protein
MSMELHFLATVAAATHVSSPRTSGVKHVFCSATTSVAFDGVSLSSSNEWNASSQAPPVVLPAWPLGVTARLRT